MCQSARKQCFLSIMSVNFIWSQFSLLFSVGFFFKQEDKIKTQLENLSHVHLTNLTIPTILTRQDVETMRYKKNKCLKMILGNTIRLEMNCWWNITAHLSLTMKIYDLLDGCKRRINQINGPCVTTSSMNYKKKYQQKVPSLELHFLTSHQKHHPLTLKFAICEQTWVTVSQFSSTALCLCYITWLM